MIQFQTLIDCDVYRLKARRSTGETRIKSISLLVIVKGTLVPSRSKFVTLGPSSYILSALVCMRFGLATHETMGWPLFPLRRFRR